MPKNSLKHILVVIIFAAFLYLAFAIYADYELLLHTLSRFDWSVFPILLFLALINYYARFIKWHYYLSLLEIRIGIGLSQQIFFSGLVMSITPGKIGEFLKPYLLNKTLETPIEKTIPVVITERLTDFLSLLVIALSGVYLFNYGEVLLLGTGLFLVLLLILLSNRSVWTSLFKYLRKYKKIGKYSDKMKDGYESIYILVKFRPLLLMVLLSTLAWFAEGFALYLILTEFGSSVSILWTCAVYAFSTIAGAISFLPGGLGVTEGSLTLLINNSGFPLDVSVLSTFLARIVTLWFAVLVGLISLYFLRKKIDKNTNN